MSKIESGKNILSNLVFVAIILVQIAVLIWIMNSKPYISSDCLALEPIKPKLLDRVVFIYKDHRFEFKNVTVQDFDFSYRIYKEENEVIVMPSDDWHIYLENPTEYTLRQFEGVK